MGAHRQHQQAAGDDALRSATADAVAHRPIPRTGGNSAVQRAFGSASAMRLWVWPGVRIADSGGSWQGWAAVAIVPRADLSRIHENDRVAFRVAVWRRLPA